ncbi:DNA-binding response regulator, OmpR family, contains REC and winged-helix (wHTH) domain [Pseudooceanicola nitratireducens]|jgi:two-component system cell cycle response regulator CtrA|uniref:DNA-binding response regulator, OmpR family, contains REC and winged-helix (WHTH) domain n=2 Tax=Pseudooceanicola nitratireducens TaxID=517719 RepID=A0A1I1Q5X4_9RHOB|nr:response regulator transcription factor [Pseudooceanicola nitratireducens]MEC7297804.1 response regulator transcription factor [Pseudomonadota bacterium]MEC7793528.1 response regulator transcription factor [Pseudomonadota bacterium]SEJ70596.1 two-component system, cell cycle response regulator CtrA [Pseudooceanicola nitratireducens]SFD14613.1 DNA-binding response regulator, OmpR family, contains REC and winged-helix (wHTH) domain [Pseudooceanicola nitratireducens]
MHIYLYEPRADRLNGLMAELRSARMKPVPIQEAFFRGELGLLNRSGHEDRPFLLADNPEVLEQITALRTAGCTNPILVMRDFRNSRDTAAALDAGADDDIVIPVKAIELKARINAVTRRSHGHAAESIEVGEVVAYFDGRDPEVSGATVKLSRREHAIFQQLVLNAGRVVSKGSIYDAVYGMSEDQPFDKVIDVYICKIRKKIDQAADSGHNYIETVHGRGYKFAAAADALVQAGGM